MVEVAPAPAKAAKKKRVNKPRTGPGLSDLIVTIVSASNERGGVSGSAIKRALTARGYDVEKNNGRVKLTLRNLVLKGTLIQAKGTGVSGSFKVSKKAAEPKAKKGNKTVKATTPATPTKKPAAKKSPKKAKKPAAKKTTKTPKKVKTPKKAAKKTSAVKRKPAKRVSKPKTKKAAPKKK